MDVSQQKNYKGDSESKSTYLILLIQELFVKNNIPHERRE
jgi:hypothetical protein